MALKVVTPVAEGTQFALGGAGGAHGSTVQYQPVTEVVGLLRRQDGSQLFFHLGRVLVPSVRPRRPLMRMQWVSATTTPGSWKTSP